MKAKIKRITISPERLFEIMTDGTAWRMSKGIPKDAKLRGFTLDPHLGALNMFVEHPSFEDVSVEDQVAPKMEILFRKIQ